MSASAQSRLQRVLSIFVSWFDSDCNSSSHEGITRVLRIIPFIALHVGCFAVFWVGYSWQAVAIAVFLYCFRVFALTAFYHRYFSHRSFKTSRFFQFIFAICGLTAIQRGPLWWAAHHRDHHTYSDKEGDAHSPNDGILRSHIGWFTEGANFKTKYERVSDWTRYPELVFLNRFDSLVPILLIFGLYYWGEAAAATDPDITSGWQFVAWGGCISTVAVYHVTFCVNSVCHLIGHRRFATDDGSRNNWVVALLTFGEGWHNNHHRYPASASQGFYWWQIDITYYILRVLEMLRIVHKLKRPPANVLTEGRQPRQPASVSPPPTQP